MPGIRRLAHDASGIELAKVIAQFDRMHTLDKQKGKQSLFPLETLHPYLLSPSGTSRSCSLFAGRRRRKSSWICRAITQGKRRRRSHGLRANGKVVPIRKCCQEDFSSVGLSQIFLRKRILTHISITGIPAFPQLLLCLPTARALALCSILPSSYGELLAFLCLDAIDLNLSLVFGSTIDRENFDLTNHRGGCAIARY